MWDRKAIEEGQEELANIFVKVGEAKDLTEGQAIVTEMLDKRNQLSSGTNGHFFSATRAFEKITDDSLVVKFLNPDVRTTIMDYNFQAGKALAKKITLGVSTEERFIDKWVNSIDADMRKAGKPLTKRDKQNIVDLYRTATGENLTRYSPEVQNIADAYTLTTRVALLGGVTLSSLTEIMVNLGRAGFRNTAKAFVEASEIGFKKATKDIHSELQTRNGLTAKEAYREFQKVNIAMEQSATPTDATHRIGGGDLVNEKMQRFSNKFFRVTLLDQWTKFVQRVSFIASKNFIEENLNTLAKHGSLKPTKKIESIMGELNELDISPEQGVEWIKNGAKRSDKFYQNIINGSARYTNQVILHPTGMSGNKPMLHAKPTTTILFQLMGYPAAFTNTVLKGGFQRLVKDPTRNGFKLASTAFLMTETARMTNWIRSRGESEKNKSTEDIYKAAIARWGGFGLAADQAMKGEKALDYNRSVGATIATSLGGPVISDLNTFLSRGPVQTAQQKVPFSSLGNAIVGKEKMKEWRKLARQADTGIKEALNIEEEYRAEFNKGGEVNVPNAPIEPDERINKLTGLPYNYEAGSAYMDEDDPLKTQRGGFVIGGIVKGATKLASKAFSTKGDSGFFSMAEKKAMDLNQNKGSGDQFISMLKKNGVTEDELEFTGFNNELEICSGYDNTGDIYKLINIFNYVNYVGKHTCDIVTADGKEVLLLDELQSDVHKAGSKFGYMSKKQQNLKAQLEKRRIAIVEKLKETEGKLVRADLNIFKTETDNQEIAQLKAEMSRLTEKRSELLDEAFAQLTLNENKVPEMPFKQRKGSGWAQLGIKRALIEAAEKDYDTLAMTTGQQQVDRYAEAIEDSSGFYKRYDRDYIKILNKFGAKYGQKVEMIEVLQGDDIVEVPSINLTEEWKNDIQRGLPQFNKGGKVLKKLKRNCA